MGWLRKAIWFLFHCVIATIVPVELDGSVFHDKSGVTLALLSKYLPLDGLIALSIGWFLYRKRKDESMKWVWLVGVLWFSSHAIPFWFQNRAFASLHGDHSIFWRMAGPGCIAGDLESCRDFFSYFFPAWRLAFYSTGAVISSFLLHRVGARHLRVEHS